MSQLKTVRGKLARIMLLLSGLTGVATFSIVVMLNVQASSRHLAEVQRHIEAGIIEKGKVLTENHALALRGMMLDNAFGDMQRLVEHTVRGDPELVYGLFVGADGAALAFSRYDNALASNERDLRQAAQALELGPEQLSVTTESVARVLRLKQELLEVGVPVVDEQGAPLGNIRYGLSTRRMEEALTRAQSDARESLRRSVAWIAGLVSLITVIGVLASRLLAVRITRPIDALTRAARDLALGNRTVRVSIASGDELELLGASFNHMVDELNASYGKLEELNRTLEHQVDQRTRELELKNRDMRLVLDNVDQGFLTLSADGLMTGGRSRVVNDWFGQDPEAPEFAAYMAQISAQFGERFQLGWAQLCEQILPIELCLDQLPRELSRAERTWSFRYLPFFRGEQLEGVLVVASEISLRLAHEREEAEQRELMQGFARLMLDRTGFLNFWHEASAMIKALCTRDLDADLIRQKRTLHTLKGNAAMMGLELVARECQAIEAEIEQGGAVADASLVALSERWRRLGDHVQRFTPAGDRAIEVPATEFGALLTRLGKAGVAPELLDQIRSWRFEPATAALGRLAEQSRALADRLGKGGLQVSVRAEHVRLDPNKWRLFLSCMVHLLRNAVDHGIESPEERRAAGKSSEGHLVLGAKLSGGTLSFEISDDGRGIDWESIRRRGKARQLPCSTEGELLAVLCTDGISTKNESSDVSGRGVGMAAVKECIDQLDGRLEVRSSDQGTTWLIHFPRPRIGSQFPDATLSSPKLHATRSVAS